MTIDEQIKFIQNKLLGYQPVSWGEADKALNAILTTLKECKEKRDITLKNREKLKKQIRCRNDNQGCEHYIDVAGSCRHVFPYCGYIMNKGGE